MARNKYIDKEMKHIIIDGLGIISLVYAWSLFLPVILSAIKFEIIASISIILGVTSHVLLGKKILSFFGVGK